MDDKELAAHCLFKSPALRSAVGASSGTGAWRCAGASQVTSCCGTCSATPSSRGSPLTQVPAYTNIFLRKPGVDVFFSVIRVNFGVLKVSLKLNLFFPCGRCRHRHVDERAVHLRYHGRRRQADHLLADPDLRTACPPPPRFTELPVA